MRHPLFAWYLGIMSGVLLVEGGQTHDVFDIVERSDTLLRVRTPFLFELGEELKVRLEQDGTAYEVPARVAAHVGSGEDRITELELGERTPV